VRLEILAGLRLRLDRRTQRRACLRKRLIQDERIGRFLTAIAFLLSAAIALSTNKRVIGVEFEVQNGSSTAHVPIIAYSFASFIVLALVSVTWFILSLATQLTLPGSVSKRHSFMYFRSIAKYGREEWKSDWKTSADKDPKAEHALGRRTVDGYLDEIHNLALRANVKYERFREATAVFVVALVCLVSSSPLIVDALVDGIGPKDELRDLDWNQSRAFGVAGVLAIATASIGYHSWQQARAMNPSDTRRHKLLVMQTIGHPLFVFVLASGARPKTGLETWLVLFFGIIATAPLLRQLETEYSKRETGGRPLIFGVYLALHLAVVISSIYATAQSMDVLRVSLAVAAVALLELPSILDAMFVPRVSVP
jgi:hypothetical protein